MSKNNVKLNFDGFLQLRRTAGHTVVAKVAQEIASNATSMATATKSGIHPKYVALPVKDTKQGAVAIVTAASNPSKEWLATMRSEGRHHWLAKAVGAGK